MYEKEQNVANMISELKDTFYDTPDRLFLALAKVLIKDNYTEPQIKNMVDKTIRNVNKTKLTVADVIVQNVGEIFNSIGQKMPKMEDFPGGFEAYQQAMAEFNKHRN